MILMLFRHGIAIEAEEFEGPDFDRPLTARGKRRTKQAARGLAREAGEVDKVLTSPKVRALQTAEILCGELGGGDPENWKELAQEKSGPTIKRLERLARTGVQTVICVGHEPNLSFLASQFLTGNEERLNLDLKKAGAVSMEIEFKPTRGRLLWHLTSTQLRVLGRRRARLG